MPIKKLDTLKKMLNTPKTGYKNPTEAPANRGRRTATDSFQRAASSVYQQAMLGSAQRQDRVKDFEMMDDVPEISKALDIYADDSTTYNEYGKVIEVNSPNERIVQVLTELYEDRLDVDFNLWHWARNTCKYGDFFLLLDISEKEGVVSTIPMPVMEMQREEGHDGNPNSVRFKWSSQGQTAFENYQISHFRLIGDDRFLPYGRSILDPARRVFKQLQLAEDAMLIYRFTRAPERRIFYVDVANIPPNQVEGYINQARDKLKRTPLMTESNGLVDLRFNPVSIDEDFFIPVRGDRGSRVETLPGGSNQGDIDDINYLQNKLFISLGVPKSYLTAEEDLSGKATLAQEDIKFARTIQRIQRVLISELAKVGIIHLFMLGFDEKEIYDFDLKLTNPSTVMDQMQLDLIEKKFDIGTRIKDSKLASQKYIQTKILGFASQDLETMNKEMEWEAKQTFKVQQLENEGQLSSPEDEEIPQDGEGDSENVDGGEENMAAEKPDQSAAAIVAGKNTDSDVYYDKDPMNVPDPTGTQYMNNVPSPKRKHQDNNEQNDRLFSSEEDMNGFINSKTKKKRSDFLNKNISDVLRFDSELKTITETLRQKFNKTM